MAFGSLIIWWTLLIPHLSHVLQFMCYYAKGLLLITGSDSSMPTHYRMAASKPTFELQVHLGGLEPPRLFGHMILSHARLPIPPQVHSPICSLQALESEHVSTTLIRIIRYLKMRKEPMGLSLHHYAASSFMRERTLTLSLRCQLPCTFRLANWGYGSRTRQAHPQILLVARLIPGFSDRIVEPRRVSTIRARNSRFSTWVRGSSRSGIFAFGLLPVEVVRHY